LLRGFLLPALALFFEQENQVGGVSPDLRDVPQHLFNSDQLIVVLDTIQWHNHAMKARTDTTMVFNTRQVPAEEIGR
jgi:hypothetical protein